MNEGPVRIKFVNEEAVDLGGVARDMFSAFWAEACLKFFDGVSTLVPAVHPGCEIEVFTVIGTILSHGFLCTGFLPVSVSFPVIAAALHGPGITIPNEIVEDSSIDYLGMYEKSVVREALSNCNKARPEPFKKEVLARLVDILSRMGCRVIPKPDTFKKVVVDVAVYEMLTKPLIALNFLRSGIHSFQLVTCTSCTSCFQLPLNEF